MNTLLPLSQLPLSKFETNAILKKQASASRALAELKGFATAIPRQEILINALCLQEAKDSSAIENIATTHDELYRDDLFTQTLSMEAKEVLRYRQALWTGFQLVKDTGLLTLNHIRQIQEELECNNAGFRRQRGTEIRDGAGRTLYVPPQDYNTILELMSDLEKFLNESDFSVVDPLVKMALIHHQFESIHPFFDGNGRTGRIINVLYLVKENLLEIPILYMSRYILQTKSEYYRLLQAVREEDAWEEWVIYMLTAVEEAALDAITSISQIRMALQSMKHEIRDRYKFYSQDLLNNLFSHPYTKIDFLMDDLNVSRLTATKYLDDLTDGGFLEKRKVGRSNYYINKQLYAILGRDSMV